MNKRYERNIPAISEAEQTILAQKKVLVIGCGGLGGYVIEYLARLGVGHITAVDGDVFDVNNLNRQLYSSPDLIGQSKAYAAAARITTISPDTSITPIHTFLDETNADELINGHDLVIDALDNISSRFILEDFCEKQNVLLVHGAILGWNIQATTVRPGKRVLHAIYQTAETNIHSESVCKTSLSMVPPVCAAIEVAEAVKLLTGRNPSLESRLFMFNLETMEQHMIPV